MDERFLLHGEFSALRERTMSNIRETVGHLDGTGKRLALVASRFNARLVDSLLSGAVDCCIRNGVQAEDLLVVRVPGAWEIPQALDLLAQRGGFEALVALGVVIRGETAHFDYICAECSRRTSEVSRRYSIPVGFGVLTCENSAQAQERCGGKAGNKGWAAAEAALEMADLFARLASDD